MNTAVSTKAKTYISITNEGLIDHMSLHLIGASTKRNDSSKIGFFGSGLKYAIALMLREEIPFEIWSGEKKIPVTKRKVDFRGETFERIYIGGKPTSFTTDMGPDWKPWYAIREILCNAIDEGNHKVDIVGEKKPCEGTTSIFIHATPKIEEVLKNWHLYFADARKDEEHKEALFRCLKGNEEKMFLYRKGIRVYEEYTPCLYHYDFPNFKINESRVVSSTYDCNEKIVGFWKEYATKRMIEKLFEAGRVSYEWKMGWDTIFSREDFSEEWLEAIAGRSIISYEIAGYFSELVRGEECIQLPPSLVKALEKCFGEKVKVLGKKGNKATRMKVEKTQKQTMMLEKALDFLKKGGVDIQYKIYVSEFDSKIINAEADMDTEEIFLAPSAFEYGMKSL